jgi:hypothetical protein
MLVATMIAAAAATSPPLRFPNTIGAPCDRAYVAELGRASKQTQTQVEPTHDVVWFEGRYGGQPVLISYTCRSGKVQTHYISRTFLEEAQALTYLRAQQVSLDQSLGASCRMYDTLSPANQSRIRREKPGQVQELQDTRYWRVTNGTGLIAKVEFSPSDGGWTVVFMASEGNLTCRTTPPAPPNNRMQRSGSR